MCLSVHSLGVAVSSVQSQSPGGAQSQLVLGCCMKSLIQLHNEGVSMSWTDSGVDVLLRWMLTDVDDGHIQQVYTQSSF